MVLLGPNRQRDDGAGGVDFVPPRVAERFLPGDETAAPASARGVAVVETPSDVDVPYLPAHPGIEVRVTGREGHAHGEVLTEGVRRAAEELCPIGVPQEVEEIDVGREPLWDVPHRAKGRKALKRTTLYAWPAGEAAAVRTTRRHLASERDVNRRSAAFMGHWRQGRAEG